MKNPDDASAEAEKAEREAVERSDSKRRRLAFPRSAGFPSETPAVRDGPEAFFALADDRTTSAPQAGRLAADLKRRLGKKRVVFDTLALASAPSPS